MADAIINTVRTRITEKRRRALSSTVLEESTIFRVPRQLYEVNKKAYEPEIISIGPYHRGKNHLEMMEVHKVRFLEKLFEGQTRLTVNDYIAELGGQLERARKCYSESSSITTEDFLEMLVLDGCFIVEFIHQLHDQKMDEYVFRLESTLTVMLHDLILFENQLPFFVLWDLFDVMWTGQRMSRVESLLRIFRDELLERGELRERQRRLELRVDVDDEITSTQSAKHLLDLVHRNWRPPTEVPQARADGNWKFIRSATELKEAGIRFKWGEENSLFKITFTDGVLTIPRIKITDYTEKLYRNVIVCEQFERENPKYFTEFITFMNCLINSGKDVELLCQCEIIESWLGSDEAVATMFNMLGENVKLSIEFYGPISKYVHEYYSAPWNKSIASLRHNYFNTPWAFISFLAAAFLLLLTLLQTIFTIFPSIAR